MAKGGAYLDSLLIEYGLCGWFPAGIFFLHFVVGFSNVFLYLGNTMATWIPRDLQCPSEDGGYEGGGSGFDGGGGGGGGIQTNGSQKDATFSFNQTSNLSATNNLHLASSPSWLSPVNKSASLALEWNLICDREHLVNLTEVFFFVGCIVGCTFCGYLSDKFGRRRTVMASGLFAGFVGIFMIWVPNLEFYCALRFLLGIAFTGLTTMSS